VHVPEWLKRPRGRRLIARMEDHYVRAHTAAGSTLILMRLRDALAELAGLAGRQVHRSYWAAEAAVAHIDRADERIRLVLRNGLTVPVSRRHLPELRAAGWLESNRFGGGG
jgi:DNA-binding LytR/AlgR family response regulator